MEIELFTITNKTEMDRGIRKENIGNRSDVAKIVGKQLLISPLNNTDYKPDFKNFYIKCPFRCKFDLPFDIEVKLKSGSNQLLNTEITYTNYIDDKHVDITVYAYLTWLQRLKVKCRRNQLWIQQASNIMWIVNVLVAILAILASINS